MSAREKRFPRAQQQAIVCSDQSGIILFIVTLIRVFSEMRAQSLLIVSLFRVFLEGRSLFLRIVPLIRDFSEMRSLSLFILLWLSSGAPYRAKTPRIRIINFCLVCFVMMIK